MFKTYVRPKLEYATVIWSPHSLEGIDLLESVQRKFTKRLASMNSLSYLDRLKFLEIPSLEERRLILDLITVYKLIHNIFCLHPSKFLSLAPNRLVGIFINLSFLDVEKT